MYRGTAIYTYTYIYLSVCVYVFVFVCVLYTAVKTRLSAVLRINLLNYILFYSHRRGLARLQLHNAYIILYTTVRRTYSTVHI